MILPLKDRLITDIYVRRWTQERVKGTNNFKIFIFLFNPLTVIGHYSGR